MSRVALGISAIMLAVSVLADPALAAKTKPINDEEVEGLFASTCGYCHQDGGRVAGKGPQLMGTTRSNAYIINRIKQGKEGRMPSFGAALSDSQIKSIIHYIRNLKSE
jgi:mono/diheme cytochrome c family protein